MQTLLTANRTHVQSWPRRFLTGGLLLTAALMFSACASKPNSYYTLSMPAPKPASHAQTAPIFIELLAVAVPERLARPQMVLSQTAANSAEVVMLEQHRWISSFENELRDALTSGIVNSIGAVDVSKVGRQPTQPSWRIAVQLSQFNAIENTRVDARFNWSIRRSDATNSSSCQWSGTEAVGRGINSLAQGAQHISNQAALAIAQHLTMLAADNTMTTCPQ
jgi:uncharacterized lipoprotein YmbA